MNYEEYKKIMDECLILSKKKNQDYWNNVLLKFGEMGLLIRMNDKIERLNNLINYKQQLSVSDEKIEDTIKDLINYSIYLLIIKRGELKWTWMIYLKNKFLYKQN